MGVEFRLLGDIEAFVDGRLIDIGAARQRSVLAVLLIEANHSVPVDQLVDRVWGERRLPDSPSNALQTYISLLRRALAPAEEVTISWQSGGYALSADPLSVDLHRFHSLIGQARTAVDDETSAALLGQALDLCRAEPFATLDTPWFNAIRATLNRQRLATEFDLTDIRLRAGQHTALVAELFDRAAGHPLDERLAGQLMLALYRSGRQADALDHYLRVGQRLADELGADPSPPLRRLHQQILTGDPALAAPTVLPAVRPDRPVVPRQLPAPPRSFTGRTEELARLDRALDEPGGTMVIGGTGGIGKTWLAQHWAQRNLDRFPDGQLYVNLRGFDPSGDPTPPTVAARGFLDALGVAPTTIPVELDAQAALYRSLVAGRRMLVLLDNARDTAQATPLLPGGPSCTVLVTSRRQLTGLITAHGALSLDLDTLGEAEARELLTRHLGSGLVDAEPEAIDEILACCAGLPLALSIVAARATTRPYLPLRALAAELRQVSARLDALDTGDLAANVRAVLAWSYHALDSAAAGVFGLLGLAPGADISLAAAASLIGLPVPGARAVLRELENAHLVQQHVPDRYRMHDLVRLYAAEQAGRDQPEDRRDAALRRLVEFCVHTAYAGDRLLEPYREPLELAARTSATVRYPMDDEATALAWFDNEHADLRAVQELAVERAWQLPAWQLAWALDTFYQRRGYVHDHVAAWRTGLAAAQQLGRPAEQVLAHRRLGYACARSGQHIDALEHLRQALDLAVLIGDRNSQAHTHHALAWAWELHGDNHLALSHATYALDLYRTADNPAWEAMALNQVGWCHTLLGNHEPAQDYSEQALSLHRKHNDREGEATSLDSLGRIAYDTGQHHQALEYYHQALALCRDLGHSYSEADTLDWIGRAHAALGDREPARRSWRQAIALYRNQNRASDAERVDRLLAAFDQQSNGTGPDQAT